ncbi:MAG: ester cyclase [Candidatus Aminicenantes bacterium]|nr:ester cyclase [Candidatus Aminicenantes bacterium]
MGYLEGEKMKKLYVILPLAMILCFMIGCQDKAAMAELEQFRAQAALEEQNKKIVRRYAEEEDKGNLLEIIDEIVAPDVIYHYPNNVTVNGLESIKESSPQFHKAFPDLKHTIEFQMAEGEYVTTRYTWKGTHKGKYLGVEPTGKELTFTFIDVGRVKDGKIVEAWIELDFLGVMQQLGMELKPKEDESLR